MKNPDTRNQMPAYALRIAIAAVSIGLLPNSAVLGQSKSRSDSRDPLEIINAFVGFPSAARFRGPAVPDRAYKLGAWTPVYVTVQCHKEYAGPTAVVVESSDCDEVPTRYAVALPQMQPGQTETVIGYTRPGTNKDNIVVSVVPAGGGRGLAEPSSQIGIGMEPAHFLFLTMGSPLDNAAIPGLPPIGDDPNASNPGNYRSVQVELQSPSEMPTASLGYGAVDLAILTTANREKTIELINERTGRKAALAEWVRNGGRLVISAGRNTDLLSGASELFELLPGRPDGTAELQIDQVAWKDGTAAEEPLGSLTVSKWKLRSERLPQVLVAGPKSAAESPLVVRANYGLGRVTLVTFDLEDKAVARWPSRKGFWQELCDRAAFRVPKDNLQHQSQFGMGRFGGYQVPAEDGELSALVTGMENFPGVPVISFGWVALFILIYIIIVGPLDYWFLKRVVKRLELTWITFPTIVLLVSAGAYYAAYALKGSDLRINKFDLVDIDATSGLVQGRSWFTLFSPRIQNYLVGVEPAAPIFTVHPTEFPDVKVGWSGLPRPTRQSLFRRGYDYRPQSTGLIGVPIQVWSTKGFESKWTGPTATAKPLVASTLRQAPNSLELVGSITVNLPTALENACLIYSGGSKEPMVRRLGVLLAGSPKAVSAQEPKPFNNWVSNPFAAIEDSPQPSAPIAWFPTNLLFTELHTTAARNNASLRDIDMSWRLSSADVAILVGTLPQLDGPAESVNNNPANPSRLWLGGFPEPGQKQPNLEGMLRQDTCVRIVLPVQSTPSQ